MAAVKTERVKARVTCRLMLDAQEAPGAPLFDSSGWSLCVRHRGRRAEDRKSFSWALTPPQAFPAILASGFLQFTSHSTPRPPPTPSFTHEKSFPVQTTRRAGSETTNVSSVMSKTYNQDDSTQQSRHLELKKIKASQTPPPKKK